MAVLIGSARLDERNKAHGGAAGDQKQTSVPDYRGEVSIQNFYVHRKGWNVIRAKDAATAIRIASAMTRACNNKNVGYDQGQRLGIIANGTGSKVKTECDCSSLVRQCVKEATGKDPGNFNTESELNALNRTGLFDSHKYRSGETLYTGDILVTCTKGHTVIVTSGAGRQTAPAPAPAPTSGAYFPACGGGETSIVRALASVGVTDTSFNHRAQIAAANGIGNYSGTAAQNVELLNRLKQGRLLNPSGNSNFYPAYTGGTTSITAALAAVGEGDTSYNHRERIANANGIGGYRGSALQNTQLLNLLKQGRLRKA